MSWLLILLCASVVFQSTGGFTTYATTTVAIPTLLPTTTRQTFTTTRPPPVQLHLRPVPDYPVTVGQTVVLHCEAPVAVPGPIIWIWERRSTNDSTKWTEEGRGAEMTLSRPEQSGYYQCKAESPHREFVKSNAHYVYITSTHQTAVDDLGIAGFVFSLLAFILTLAAVLWLLCQKFNTTPTLPITSTDPANTPKAMEVAPPGDSDGDVYMNYTSPNDGYVDLDPSNVNDDVYSSLS